MALYDDYLSGMKTLKSVQPKSAGKTTMTLIIASITITALILWFTPWIQTAQGTGLVSTVSPDDRQQAISALVPGQIEQWHVIEGQKVEAGDPIVSLRDQDSALIERLRMELAANEREREAAALALSAAEADLERQERLLENGLVSPRQRDQVLIKLQDSRAKLASIEASINQTKTRLARQSRQTKVAPSKGVITQLFSGGIATSVNAGDVIARFVPTQVERAILVKVSGLDAPLVQPGRKVRLQFEGWPVFQFSGWPATAVGTFGGKVSFVEPVANPDGTFNVWIEQDPKEQQWPSADMVRLGSQARAWILLEEVRLGYEIWRQLNNFPPNYPNDLVQ